MKRILLAGVFFVAAIAFGSPAAVARDSAPWCAVFSIGAGAVVWDCEYNSIEECRPNVISGNRGFCNHNPRYEGPAVRSGPKGKRVRRH